jgi:uncharacterized membrane protein
MIAPIRSTEAAGDGTRLAPARRAVAELLFREAGSDAVASGPPVSRFVGWMFVGWAFALVASYLLRGGWWNRGS